MDNFVLITGCSGGGKSSLLSELSRRGFLVVDEPGRRIVKSELECDGTALPWRDMAAFLDKATALALRDREAMRHRDEWVFFDRGLIDTAGSAQGRNGSAIDLAAPEHRYHGRVLAVPPWPEIFRQDHERRHDFADAVAEFERICSLLPGLGYETILLPKLTISERADFVIETLGPKPAG